MLQLAAEVYGPQPRNLSSPDPLAYVNPNGNNTGAKVSATAQTRNWHPVSAIELGMAAADFGDPVLQTAGLSYSFVGGQYQAIGSATSEANALVLTGNVNGVPTLAIAIRGTDQLADSVHYISGFSTYYNEFAPLVAALKIYLGNSANGIQQVLISGHSLGAAVVPYFMHDLQGSGYTIKGYTDGFPGDGLLSSPDISGLSLENFVHSGSITSPSNASSLSGNHLGDPVPGVGGSGLYKQAGTFVDIDSDVHQPTLPGLGINKLVSAIAGTDVSFFGPQHNENLYELDLARVLEFARDPDSPFSKTSLASALINNTPYTNADPSHPIAIAVGQPQPYLLQQLLNANFLAFNAATLANPPYQDAVNVYARDNYVLGTPSGKILWDIPQSTDALHIVDGDGGSAPFLPGVTANSAVVLPAVSGNYAWSTNVATGETDLYAIFSNISASLDNPLDHTFITGIARTSFSVEPGAPPQCVVNVSGTTVPDSSVVLSDGPTSVSCTADANGNWSASLTLASGVNQLFAKASDSQGDIFQAGNVATASLGLIGQLYRVNELVFNNGESFFLDPPSNVPVVKLDGSALNVQTPAPGQTTLTVDPSFDYTDTGDGNISVIGSNHGDIIAIGAGNDTITEGNGSDIIFVKDRATAGNITITLGSGNDNIVTGAGNDSFYIGTGNGHVDAGAGFNIAAFSGNRSDYDFLTSLDANSQLVTTIMNTGPSGGSDTLIGVE
jgi:hypothetical protein